MALPAGGVFEYKYVVIDFGSKQAIAWQVMRVRGVWWRGGMSQITGQVKRVRGVWWRGGDESNNRSGEEGAGCRRSTTSTCQMREGCVCGIFGSRQVIAWQLGRVLESVGLSLATFAHRPSHGRGREGGRRGGGCIICCSLIR